MDSPFLGMIQLLPYNFVPKGYAACNGALLALQSNQALFALLGTYYGGNGTTTFGLPDLQGRVAVGMASTNALGQKSGTPTVTLTANNLPAHTHAVATPVNNTAGTTSSASGSYSAVDAATATVTGGTTRATATVAPASYASSPTSGQGMAAYPTQMAGSNVPVNIEPPYLALTYCIATAGIFPSRN